MHPYRTTEASPPRGERVIIDVTREYARAVVVPITTAADRSRHEATARAAEDEQAERSR